MKELEIVENVLKFIPSLDMVKKISCVKVVTNKFVKFCKNNGFKICTVFLD